MTIADTLRALQAVAPGARPDHVIIFIPCNDPIANQREQEF
jgi:hypothetical protein